MNKKDKQVSPHSRRAFIGKATAAIFSLAIPDFALAALSPRQSSLKLGMITDLHQDVMHDGAARLEAFLEAMRTTRPDAILQLGDFAYPSDKNTPLIQRFNQAHPVPLHVIGNHDTDSGFTHRQCVEVWKMPAPYYTQVLNGYRLIVLNGNEKGSPTHKGGYPAYIGPEQTAWLRQQLADSREPVIVFCHQPLAGHGAVNNAAEIQEILTGAKDRVILAINGHTHIDALLYISDIPYLTINSASYFWVGDKYIHDSYAKEIHQEHPYISHTCPYQDSLFTTLTIDPSKKTITVSARNSTWVGKSPDELGYGQTKQEEDSDSIVPFIRQRKFSAKGRLGK